MIAIIDYDAGNIKSVEKAVQFLGEEAIITRDSDVIIDSSGVILPICGILSPGASGIRRICPSTIPNPVTPGVSSLVLNNN